MRFGLASFLQLPETRKWYKDVKLQKRKPPSCISVAEERDEPNPKVLT